MEFPFSVICQTGSRCQMDGHEDEVDELDEQEGHEDAADA